MYVPPINKFSCNILSTHHSTIINKFKIHLITWVQHSWLKGLNIRSTSTPSQSSFRRVNGTALWVIIFCVLTMHTKELVCNFLYYSINVVTLASLIPRLFEGEEEKGPGTHATDCACVSNHPDFGWSYIFSLVLWIPSAYLSVSLRKLPYKSICYQCLPFLLDHKLQQIGLPPSERSVCICIVISPLVSLMVDQVRGLWIKGVKATSCHTQWQSWDTKAFGKCNLRLRPLNVYGQNTA